MRIIPRKEEEGEALQKRGHFKETTPLPAVRWRRGRHRDHFPHIRYLEEKSTFGISSSPIDVHTPPPSFTPPMIAATLFLLPPWPSISAFEKRALLLFSYLRPLVGKGGEERRRRVSLSTFFEETFSRRPPLPSLFGSEETL